MNMIDITPVINAVIALLAAGVSVFLIPWIKSKTTDAQRKELLEWVKIGVAAAEQLYKGQGRGEEKKKYVLEFLASMGFTVDELIQDFDFDAEDLEDFASSDDDDDDKDDDDDDDEEDDGNIGYLDDISDIIPGVSIDLDN